MKRLQNVPGGGARGASSSLRPEFTLRAHTTEVQSVAFFEEDISPQHNAIARTSYQHRFLVSGDTSGSVKVWNLGSRRVVTSSEFSPHAPQGVLQVQYQAKALMSQGRDGVIALWDMERSLSSPVQLAQLVNQSHGFCRAQFVGQAQQHTVPVEPDDTKVDESARRKSQGSDDCDTPTDDPQSEDSGMPSPPLKYHGHHLIVSPAGDGDEVVLWDVRARKLASRISTREAAALNAHGNAKNPSGGNPGGMLMALATCQRHGRPYVFVGMESGSIGLFDLVEGRCCSLSAEESGNPGGLQVLPCPVLSMSTACNQRYDWSCHALSPS